MHPVVFKDKCSCGGKLLYVTKSGERGMISHAGSGTGEISHIVCELCGDKYAINWDIDTGEARPIIDRESAYADFLIFYEQAK